MTKPYHILTENAYRLWVKNVPPKGEMTKQDWDSVYAFEDADILREYIVEGIFQDAIDKVDKYLNQ